MNNEQVRQPSDITEATGELHNGVDTGGNVPPIEQVEARSQSQIQHTAQATAQAQTPTLQPQAQTNTTAQPATQLETDVRASGDDPDDLIVRSARDSRLEELPPGASMEDLLKASEEQYQTLRHGDVVEGTIMKIDRDEILVDIGAKTEGVVPAREAQSLTPTEREALKVGDQVMVVVIQPENAEGHAVLSLDRARQEKAWRDLQRRFEAGEIVEAPVIGHNKGGLLVSVEGLRGFVPASQISSMPPGETNKQAELARYHGKTLPLKIIEINRNRNRLILSERQAIQEQREAQRQRLLQQLQPGQLVTGTVTSLADFGAFVDIGGADGLIHLSELSWKRVNHPSEVLKVGDQVTVQVLSVDPQERKIALSLKRTQPEPWETISEQYHLGQVVKGTITQITSFGAFARLEDGIEGLIHVSELAEGRVAHPRQVVKEGDVLDLKVIRIDPARRRIGLSLRRMKEEEGREVKDQTPPSGAESDAQATATQPTVEVSEAQPSAAEREQSQQPQPEAQSQPEVQAQAQAQARRLAERRAPAREERRERERERAGRRGERERYEEEEPMGALAQALAAHVEAIGLGRRSRTGTDRAAEEAEVSTETGAVAPETTATEAPSTLPTPEPEQVPVTEIAGVEPSETPAGAEIEAEPAQHPPTALVQPQPAGLSYEGAESPAPSQQDTGVQPSSDSLADVVGETASEVTEVTDVSATAGESTDTGADAADTTDAVDTADIADDIAEAQTSVWSEASGPEEQTSTGQESAPTEGGNPSS